MKFLTVGDLRKKLEGLGDAMPVAIEVDCSEEPAGDLAQGELLAAGVETRCDDVERLYLWADQSVVEGTTPPAGDVDGVYWVHHPGDPPYLMERRSDQFGTCYWSDFGREDYFVGIPKGLVILRGPLKPPRELP
jgi:hypothetical protein